MPPQAESIGDNKLMGRTAPTADKEKPPRPRIRRARPADAAVLSRLAYDSKASWGYDDAFMEACRAELTISAADLEAHNAFVVACGESLLGFYLLKMDGPCAEVWDFFMAAEAMGSGLGGRLWRHLEATARRCGAACIGVDSDPNAEGFYRKMGLRRCGEAPSLSIPGRMLPRLEKEL